MLSRVKEYYFIILLSSVILVLFIVNVQDYRAANIFVVPDRLQNVRVKNNHYSFNANESGLIDVQFPTYRNNKTNENKRISILFINKPGWFDMKGLNDFLKHECPYSNCVMMDKTNTISGMSAIVFGASNAMTQNLRNVLRDRPKNQIWIFFRMEPPELVRPSWYRDPILRYTMNWSWGYRMDSDVFRPIQILRQRSVLRKQNYPAIFKRKTKFAAWVVSNCKTKGLREQFVSKLVEAGIQVDIFGRCSKNQRYLKKEDVTKMINRDYLFYLSFENNFCKDYVTEKFYTYFDLDVLLVVRGGLNYSKHFDKSAFIDASDFQSAEQLAQYLLNISRNEKEYIAFLQNKDKYITVGSPAYSLWQSGCKLCEMLNNIEQHHRVYENIDAYIHNGTCFNPKNVL